MLEGEVELGARNDDYLLGTETTGIDDATIFPSLRAAFVKGDLSPLTLHAVGAGRWGSPSDPPTELDPGAHLLPGYDYSAGIVHDGTEVQDDDALPGSYDPKLIGVHTVGIPPGIYRTPHEATHRRYEPPIIVSVNQSAAGFTLLAPPLGGLHFVKLLAAFLTLDAAGTVRFVQGDSGGVNQIAMTGNIGLGGAAVSPLQLPQAEVANPWLFTSPDQGLGIFTVTGKAQGWVIVANSPYDS